MTDGTTHHDERPVVAAFDVDGTLTRRDCVIPFLLRVRGRAGLAVRLLRRPVRLLGAVVRRDRDGMKALATAAAFQGLRRDHVAGVAREFGERVARTRLRDDTVARLQAHRAAGHTVVLVSASYDLYLTVLAARVGAHAVLGTRLDVSHAGVLTGRLEGANCRGAEKVNRLRTWLAEQRLADPEIWAYGDSAGDDQMLAMADHPVRVGAAPLPPALPARRA